SRQHQHAKQGAVRVRRRCRGVPKRTPFAISEYPRSRGLRPDDSFWLEPIARRRLQPVNMLVNCPTEQAPRRDQQVVRLIRRTAVLHRLDNPTPIVRRNLSDWTFAPNRNELAPDVALNGTGGALRRYLVADEILGDRGECVGALSLLRQSSTFFFDGRINPSTDQRAPLCGLIPGLFKCQFAVTT